MFNLKALFSGESKTIFNGAVIIGGISIVSKIIGLFRDRILVSEFGASSSLDIYYAAFRIPDFIYNLFVLGALSASFIPIFSKCCVAGTNQQDNNQEVVSSQSWHFVNIVINTLLFVLIIVSLVLIFFLPALMPLITPGFTADQLDKTVSLARIMFLSPIFLGLSGIFGGVLQSFKRFFIYSLSPIIYNIGIMVGALLLVEPFGLNGLAIGVVSGSAFHFLIQFFAVRNFGFVYNFVFDLKDKNLSEVFRLMLPRALSLGTQQLNFLMMTIIASTLAHGSLSIFNLADNLQSFPIGVFGISLAMAAFPVLVDDTVHKRMDAFVNSLKQTFISILFFTIPVSIIIFILRAQIIRIIFGTGKFDWYASVTTIDTLAFFCISIFAQSLIHLIIRAFYAMKETFVPFIIGFISVVINIILSLRISAELGVAGLALSFTISSIIYMILLIIVFEMRYSLQIVDYGLCKRVSQIIVASVALGIIVQAVKYAIGLSLGTATFVEVAVQGGLASLAGLFTYFIITYKMKFQESELAIGHIRSLLLKKSFETVKISSEKIGD